MRIWRSIASMLVLLAVCCIAAAIWSDQTQRSHTGPSAFTSDPNGQLWLGVNDEIWRLEPTGQRSQQFTALQHGLPQSPSQLAWTPFHALPSGVHSRSSGALLASAASASRLHWLDTATGQPIGTLTLQWPAALQPPIPDQAHAFAYDPQHKTIAVAATSHSAVALFDSATGAFKAQTPDSLGLDVRSLFWTEQGFWAADTQQPAMLLLHPATLQPLERIALRLPASTSNYVYALHHASAMPDAAQAQWAKTARAEASGELPFAVLAQTDPVSRMTRIYAVWRDGQTRSYALEPGQQLATRALAWHKAQLLAVDDASGQIQSWPDGVPTQPPQPWGDASLQRQLQSLQWLELAQAWLVKVGLGLATILLLFSLLIFRLTREPRLTTPAVKTDTVMLAAMGKWAKPYKAAGNATTILMGAMWPLPLGYLMMGLVIFLGLRWQDSIPLQPIATQAIFTLVGLACLLGGTVLAAIRMRSANRNADTEQFFNRQALRLLHNPELFWPHHEKGEKVRETFLLTRMHGVLPKTTWIVVTDRRLLAFQLGAWGSAKSIRLKAQWEHEEVRRVAIRRRVRFALRHQILGGGLGRYEWAAQHHSGSVISGMPSAPLPAKRSVKLIQVSRRMARQSQKAQDTPITPVAATTAPTGEGPLHARSEASLAVPVPAVSTLAPDSFWQPNITRPNNRLASTAPPPHAGTEPVFGT